MEDPEADDTGRSHSALGAVAAVLAASVLLSRIIGYLRDVALAHQVGAGALTDAYYAAFQIPDLLNYLLSGGAFSLAFIPFYTRVRASRGDLAADQLFANVLGCFGIITSVAAGILWWHADALITLQFSAFDANTHELAVHLTRIMLPAQVFFITGGIVRAVLMANGRFGAHALAPLGYNACIIAGGLSTGTVEGFAWGALVGSIVGPLGIPLVDLFRTRGVRVRVHFFDRDLRTYVALALPIMLGVSLATLDEFYDRYFGALMAAGTVATLGFARKLMLVPVAVVGQAIAAAALPTLSRLYSQGRLEELDETLLRTLRAALSLSIVGAAALWVLTVPLVDFVYLHGRFTAEAAEKVATLVAVMAFGVPGWILQQVAVRAFYAREEMWRPMMLGTAVAIAAIPLYMQLGREHGAPGLALAGVLAMSCNAAITMAWVRLRHGGPSMRGVAISGLRAVPVAAIGTAAAWGILRVTSPELPALAQLLMATAGFGAAAGVAVFSIGDETLRGLFRAISSRLAGRLSRGG